MSKRILIIDALPADVRSVYETERTSGGFSGALTSAVSDLTDGKVDCDTVYGIETNPDRDLLGRYSGVIWTGSPLSVLDDSDEVRRLGEWMTVCVAFGNPIFGICFGLQLAVKTAGGAVERNPKGDESIFARNINTTAAGKDHPMMKCRDGAFDAPAHHSDHISTLPPGALCLASNDMTDNQAVAFEVGGTEVWGCQYHPEMDIGITAVLLVRLRRRLISSGRFKNDADFDTYLSVVNRLASEPAARDAARNLRINADILDPALRMAELQCWLNDKVLHNGYR